MINKFKNKAKILKMNKKIIFNSKNKMIYKVNNINSKD